MDAAPKLITSKQAASIGCCAVRTVRRAYLSGLLTAHRRRGSRAVVLDEAEVYAWAQAEPVRPPTRGPASSRAPSGIRPAEAPRPARRPRLGESPVLDLSDEALAARRARRPT